jgi:hypothetical protein
MEQSTEREIQESEQWIDRWLLRWLLISVASGEEPSEVKWTTAK